MARQKKPTPLDSEGRVASKPREPSRETYEFAAGSASYAPTYKVAWAFALEAGLTKGQAGTYADVYATERAYRGSTKDDAERLARAAVGVES